jgi:hypothetical protein
MDEILARKAQRVFSLAAPSDWPVPEIEIQEDELLLTVVFPDEREWIEVTKEERRAIALALNQLMPSTEPLGIWVVAIRWREMVVDSVLANDL